jgi:hypothetical protein
MSAGFGGWIEYGSEGLTPGIARNEDLTPSRPARKSTFVALPIRSGQR